LQSAQGIVGGKTKDAKESKSSLLSNAHIRTHWVLWLFIFRITLAKHQRVRETGCADCFFCECEDVGALQNMFTAKQNFLSFGGNGSFACLALGVALAVFSPTVAQAADVDASGTIVMHDAWHTKSEWGTKLVLPKEGKITRVMDGTYGFDIKTESGKQVASFLDPQQAVGVSLPAGTYVLEPYVCKRHRHHHIEVMASY